MLIACNQLSIAVLAMPCVAIALPPLGSHQKSHRWDPMVMQNELNSIQTECQGLQPCVLFMHLRRSCCVQVFGVHNVQPALMGSV